MCESSNTKTQNEDESLKQRRLRGMQKVVIVWIFFQYFFASSSVFRPPYSEMKKLWFLALLNTLFMYILGYLRPWEAILILIPSNW